jgi:MFS transporter, DHA2 family, multidrug resistance protein
LNFLGANAMRVILGIMFFSSLVMMPLFLQTLLGYTSESAGLVLSGGGLVLLFSMPVVGTLAGRVQARYLIAFGWLMLAFSMFYSTRQLDLQISFGSASVLRIIQVGGLGFLFVPINLAAYVGMPPEKSNAVSGLINFMRNIGSSVGTSMVTTLLARRAQIRQLYLAAHFTPGQPAFNQAAAGLAARLAASGVQAELAAKKASALLYQSLVGQATTLAYLDTFGILAVGSAVMFVLSFALRKNQPGGGPAVME